MIIFLHYFKIDVRRFKGGNDVLTQHLKKVFYFFAFLISINLVSFSQISTTQFSGTTAPAGWTTFNAGTGNNFTFINSNGYTGTGSTGTASMRYRYNATNAANAWAFTQAISMVAGRAYRIEFFQNTASLSGFYPENLKVTVGNAANVAAQTTTLLNMPDLINEIYINRVGSLFTPTVSGNYYFGFNCYSAADQSDLFIDYVRVYELSGIYTNPTSLASFTSTSGVPSTQQAYDVSAYGLTGNLMITPPAGFEISLTSGGGFVATNPILLTSVGGIVTPTTIFVRSNSVSTTTFSGNIIHSGIGVTTLNYALNGNNTACIAGTNIATFTTNGTVNWSAASWSLGHVPTPCENVVINYNESTTGADVRNVIINVPVNIKNLTISNVPGANGAKTLNVYGAFPVVIDGNLLVSASGGNNASTNSFFGSDGSSITVNGTTTIGGTGGTQRDASFGTNSGFPVYNLKGNVTYNSMGFNYSGGTWCFDATSTQSLIDQSTYSILFENIEVGKINSPVLTIAGAALAPVNVNGGNLTVKSGATLNIPLTYNVSQYSGTAGNLILKPNATLRLGGSTGGEGASNFPLDFGNYNFDLTSTVEYYSTTDQEVYDMPLYGNLTCTNNSIKYINNYIEVLGNFSVNTGATFGCDDAAYLYGNCINNGTITGIYANSEFAFYGSAPQAYSGTGAFGSAGTPFNSWGITLFNPTTLTMNAPAFVSRINLLQGQVINANHLTIGTTTQGLIQRGGEATVNAGSLDAYPALNGSPNLTLRYDPSLSNITTGFEIPASFNTYNVYSNNPVGVSLASNLNISNDMQLLTGTFNAQTNTIGISNIITKTSGFINGVAATLRMQGANAQTIPASIFVNDDLKNLTISNTFATAPQTILAGNLNLYGTLSFGNVSSKTFNTAGFLTLKSNASGTASVADVTNSGTNSGNKVSGNVTVERYISYARKWQLLSVPTASTQTIQQAWQDNNSSTVTPTGFGVQITGPLPIAGTGLDASSATASMKYQVGASTTYTPVTVTNTGTIPNNKGYYLFVYGNRGGGPVINNIVPTTLRTNGSIYVAETGSGAVPVAVNVTGTTAGDKISVGNPLPSVVSFIALRAANANLAPVLTLWDPSLGGSFSAGVYQYFTQATGWTPSVSTSPIYPTGVFNDSIQSGQAFFVQSASGGTVNVAFAENMKRAGSHLTHREGGLQQNRDPGSISMLSAMLHNSDGLLQDGNRVVFDNVYSNGVDEDDAIKMMNNGVNFGLSKQAITLAIDARERPATADTIHYFINNLFTGAYQLRMAVQNINEPLLQAEMVDRFTGNRTPVSLTDSSTINFNVTAATASRAANRFYLVFKTTAVLPVNFVGISAARQADRSIRVNWQVSNEVNIIRYEVERSADGTNFTGIMQTDATNSNGYTQLDISPLAADNFYRIKAIGIAGDVSYSSIVKVAPDKEKALIVVTPNPVKDKKINIRFIKQTAGTYYITVINRAGQSIYKGSFSIAALQEVKIIPLKQGAAAGSYTLIIHNKAGEVVCTENIIVQ